jgi:hypothetical protein
MVSGDPNSDYESKTDAQKEWADWSAHGYRKLYQPSWMLWFGGVFAVFATRERMGGHSRASMSSRRVHARHASR